MKKILILSALISGTALAGDLSVKDCLIQEVIPGKQMTGGFFVLENSGKDTVKLIGASVEKITDKVELHEMIHKDGQMEMSQIQSYDVTPGEHLFKKGGYHIMFMDVKQFPKAGETYPVELKFDNKETLKCDAKVLTVEETLKHFKLDEPKAGEHKAGDMKDAHHDHGEKKADDHGHAHGKGEHKAGDMKDAHHDHGEKKADDHGHAHGKDAAKK